jgi:hypothetical protein
VLPAVGERNGVAVPTGPDGVPGATRVGVIAVVVPAGVPAPGDGEPIGLPIGTTVVPAGGRVAVGCERAIAATVADTRACTVPSTFTGAAASPPQPATSAAERSATPICLPARMSMKPRTLTGICYNRRRS